MSDPDKNLLEASVEVSEIDLNARIDSDTQPRSPSASPSASQPASPSASQPGSQPAAQSGTQSGNQMSAHKAVAQSIWAKLLIVVVNASTGIISARSLLPAGRGELATMILWPVFLGGALTLGVPSAVTFQMRHHPQKRGQLVGAGLLISLFSSAIAMLLGALFLPVWIHQYPPEIVFYARLFLLSCPLTSLVLVGRAALESDGNFSASNLLLLGSPVLTLSWLSVLWITHTMTPVRAAFSYVIVGIIPIGWMLRLLWQKFSPTLISLPDSLRMLFSYGLRSYGIDLCGALALYVDQALVVRVLSPSTMGIYVVALSLSRMLNAFHTSVVMVLFPRAVSRSPETVREMTGRAARLSTLLTTIGGIGVILLGPQALRILYGSAYSGALAVLDVLVVEVVISGATLVLCQAFMALGRPGVITMLQIGGLMLSIPLILLFTPKLGILGAGLALLVSTAARFILVMISFPIFLKLPMPDVLPRWTDCQTLFAIVQQRLRRSSDLDHAGTQP